jgi:hypothetical protein
VTVKTTRDSFAEWVKTNFHKNVGLIEISALKAVFHSNFLKSLQKMKILMVLELKGKHIKGKVKNKSLKCLSP